MSKFRNIPHQNINISTCTVLFQLVFAACLSIFLVTVLVVSSDYGNEDVLFLRRVIREDALKLSVFFSTPGFQSTYWSFFDAVSWAVKTFNTLVENLFALSSDIFNTLLEVSQKKGASSSFESQEVPRSRKIHDSETQAQSPHQKTHSKG